ncbi:hypothetical protein LDENG_00232980 [Lucifuga dentata]|nr:hypothetical protein LDENG_00232980 [Lucifuga dentata]
MEVWKVGKTFLIHRSSSMLWEMIVSNVTSVSTQKLGLKEHTSDFACLSPITLLPTIFQNTKL